MNICPICNCLSNTFSLGPFARDERLPLVERILGLLIESRFENGRAELLDEFGKARCVVPAVCLDLHPKPFSVPIGMKASRSQSGALRNAVISTIQACLTRIARLVNIVSTPFLQSPSTLGRGSPFTEPCRRHTGKLARRIASGTPPKLIRTPPGVPHVDNHIA